MGVRRMGGSTEGGGWRRCRREREWVAMSWSHRGLAYDKQSKGERGGGDGRHVRPEGHRALPHLVRPGARERGRAGRRPGVGPIASRI
eukprot:2846685-Pyramimonas_sp.AAC.1